MVVHGETHFMLKDKLYILDNIFSHAESSSWYNKPTEFEWIRSYNSECMVFTDNHLKTATNYETNKKYGWLVESPKITPHAYDFIKTNFDKFDKVFTFSKELLDISNKFSLNPHGGCWIREEDRVIHDKTKMVSIIASPKTITEGHRLRHSVINTFNTLEVFGFHDRIENKITGLKDFRFSIVIENCKEDYYFTEKLIDCFITGTVPIYWGCPSISDFFDSKGMITFNDIDDLNKIIDGLSEEKYNEMFESVKLNYELSKNYLIADDLIYNNIKNEKSD